MIWNFTGTSVFTHYPDYYFQLVVSLLSSRYCLFVLVVIRVTYTSFFLSSILHYVLIHFSISTHPCSLSSHPHLPGSYLTYFSSKPHLLRRFSTPNCHYSIIMFLTIYSLSTNHHLAPHYPRATTSPFTIHSLSTNHHHVSLLTIHEPATHYPLTTRTSHTHPPPPSRSH